MVRIERARKLAGSSFKAIGALSYAKLGRLNWETKQYDPACVLSEQLELLSLIGDIALKDGIPQVHAHVVVGRSDGIAQARKVTSLKSDLSVSGVWERECLAT